MNEKIKEFLKKAAQDEQLAAKLGACKTPEEAYVVASGIVEGFSKEEFIAAMDQVKAAADASTTLSEEDIHKMAGGIDWSDVSISGGASASSASVSIAASAAAI